MRKHFPILIFTILVLLISKNIFGQITGDIWKTDDSVIAREFYKQKIKVNAYDQKNKLIATAQVDYSSHYHLDIADGQRVRLEFISIPESHEPVAGYSLIRFITSPGVVSLGLYDPSHFTGKNPIAVQAVYAQGALTNKDIDSISSIVSYLADDTNSNRFSSLTDFKATGSLWGIAYDRVTRRLFSSALAKRQSSLGPLGTGGIYITNLDGGKTKPFVNLDAIGFSTRPFELNRTLRNEVGVVDHDSLMFSQIGKIGLGGLDISDDSRFLYTINLFDRQLYRIKLGDDEKVPTAEDIARYPLPFEKYAGGNARPFAVKYYNGQVYVGVVCDAQISQDAKDLQAYIYVITADEVEPDKAKFKEVTHFSLNYPRGAIDYNVKGWFPWTDNYLQAVVPFHSSWMIYPQPMLADIEFDTDGSLIVSLMDRLGHQTGNGDLYRPKPTGSFLTATGISGGDVLRLGKMKKNFATEQNGQIGARVSRGQNNGEGPGGGEFYSDDSFSTLGITWHQETSAGGIALLPDENRLLVSVREPDQYTTGGVKWFDNKNGKSVGALSVFPGGMKQGYFWKGNNVGDIELITQLPPTEIGDRVWLDNDGDGIQGADEPALAGVELELYRSNQMVGKTVSDLDGRYIFDNNNVSETIKSRTGYEVRIPLKQSGRQLDLTVSKRGAVEIDNDAVVKTEGYGSILFTTTNPGENIHNLDIGVLCNDQPLVSAGIKCSDNRVQLYLTGFRESERYILTPSSQFEGASQYASATPIKMGGMISESVLSADKPYQATVRILASSGCYQDVYVTSGGNPECQYISDNQELKSPYSLSVYPNPGSGPIQVKYRGNSADASISLQITDTNGHTLKTVAGKLENGYYGQTFNIASYASGSYILIVKEGTRQTAKNIVKN